MTIKKDIPARSGEFIPKPEEKSIFDKSIVASEGLTIDFSDL